MTRDDRVVDVAALNRRKDDEPIIEHFRSVLREHRRMNSTELLKSVHARSGASRSQVARVFETYCATDEDSKTGLWLQTRVRRTNARIIELIKRGGGSENPTT